MEQAEIKVTVEYVIKAPADIMVAQVDEYINDALDEGADSEHMVSRIITDVAFAERPGIVERMNEALKVLNNVEIMTDPDNQHPENPVKTSEIYPMVSAFLDVIGEVDESED